MMARYIPRAVHVLAQRAHVSNAEMWVWHQHVTDTAGKKRAALSADALTVSVQQSPVTNKIYQFLLQELSCEV